MIELQNINEGAVIGHHWASMKRGGCKFGYGKNRGCSLSKKRGGGSVVSQLVPKLKESAPAGPGGGGGLVN